MKKRRFTRRQMLETGAMLIAGAGLSRTGRAQSKPGILLERRPGSSHVWILGGGSGHGSKHGPALGERAAATLLGERRPDPELSLSREKISSFP
jgi:glycine/D-amino acid oxidase-like deaminating enzyme